MNNLTRRGFLVDFCLGYFRRRAVDLVAQGRLLAGQQAQNLNDVGLELGRKLSATEEPVAPLKENDHEVDA
jgi:hypothetical protein